MQKPDKAILKPEDKERFLAFIQRQVGGHPVVKVHHAKWKELIEWENGDQFSQWDEKSNQMLPVKLGIRKKRTVVNLMKPLAEAIEGKVNFISDYSGMPNSSDLNDIAAAKVATALLAHGDYINKTENLNEDLKYELIRVGNACRTWQFEQGEFGFIKGANGTIEKSVGEVIGRVPSIFNIRPDPTAKSRDDMRWFIELAEVTQDSILENFDVTEDKLKEAEEASGKYAGMYEKEHEKDQEEKTHIIKYYWEKKNSRYDTGRLILILGKDVILWQGPNPALGEIPFFLYGYKRYGNSMWHTGPLHHVQDIQREFNRNVSITSEHIEAWRPKLGVPPGAILKNGAFTMDAAEIVEIDDSKGRPFSIPQPELSPQVAAFRDFLMNAKDIVSNVHEVTYSQLPQYATRAPAALYSMMLEQENIKIDPMIKNINKILVEEGSFRLRLMEHYYKQPRLVKVIGKSNEASLKFFSGADLKSNTDVKLNIGVNLHQSKVVQQRLLLDLKSNGAPIEWNKVYKLLGEGDLEQELRGDIADETRAIRENSAFINDEWKKTKQQGGVFIYLHDNHELHLDYHTNLAKSEEAQGWADDKWNALQAHIKEHFTYAVMLRSGQTPTEPTATPPGTTEQPPPAGTEAVGGAAQTPESAMQEQATAI